MELFKFLNGCWCLVCGEMQSSVRVCLCDGKFLGNRLPSSLLSIGFRCSSGLSDFHRNPPSQSWVARRLMHSNTRRTLRPAPSLRTHSLSQRRDVAVTPTRSCRYRNLSGNQLTKLDGGTFASLTKLQVLSLDGNRISSVGPASFLALTALTSLWVLHHLP